MEDLILEYRKHDIVNNGIDDYSKEDLEEIFPSLHILMWDYRFETLNTLRGFYLPIPLDDNESLEEAVVLASAYSRPFLKFENMESPFKITNLVLYLEIYSIFEKYGIYYNFAVRNSPTGIGEVFTIRQIRNFVSKSKNEKDLKKYLHKNNKQYLLPYLEEICKN